MRGKNEYVFPEEEKKKLVVNLGDTMLGGRFCVVRVIGDASLVMIKFNLFLFSSRVELETPYQVHLVSFFLPS